MDLVAEQTTLLLTVESGEHNQLPPRTSHCRDYLTLRQMKANWCWARIVVNLLRCVMVDHTCSGFLDYVNPQRAGHAERDNE